MTEYLKFAKILDELFKGLSECGLLTSYTVQLQSNMVGLETLLKFRSVIQELIQNLKALLLIIPSLEASTETVEEVVLTCHPISFTTLRTSTTVDSKTSQQTEKAMLDNSENGCGSDNSSAIEVCELKPLLIEADENLSHFINFQPDMKKEKVESIVHIVVEAPSSDSSQSFHSAKTDENIEDAKSTQCDVIFKTKGDGKLHVHTQRCDMCDEVFDCVQNLQEHCRKDHDGIGCFSCPTCTKRFMTKVSYNRHIDTHKGKKKAVCNLCDKAFSRPDYLQTHYQSHLGKRNFACSQCPRKFVRSIHLKVHEKIHSGVKDHICKVCNKGFGRRDKLKEHVLRHLNIKRFQCPVCKRDYAEKRDLKIHVKSHTK